MTADARLDPRGGQAELQPAGTLAQVTGVHPVVGQGDGDTQRIGWALMVQEPVEGGVEVGRSLLEPAPPRNGVEPGESGRRLFSEGEKRLRTLRIHGAETSAA